MGTPEPRIALQLYSVRDKLQEDFEGTLRSVADIGFHAVEFYDYGGLSDAQLVALLDETKLTVIACHVSFERLRKNLQRELQTLHALGNPYLVFPYVDEAERGDEHNWTTLLNFIADISHQADAVGIRCLYHNHDFEFTETLQGLPVMEALVKLQAPLQFELDLAWLTFAAVDATAWCIKLHNRIPIVHLKEMDGLLPGTHDPDTLPLGDGDAPLEEWVTLGIAAGTEWFVVEQDFSRQGDSLGDVAIGLRMVQHIFKMKGIEG